MYSWVWACTPGVIRSTTFGDRQALGVERVEPVELVEAVDDDVADALAQRHPQLVDALVVAVHRQRVGRDAGAQRDEHLAAAGDVEQHPLLVREARHRHAQERLGRVDRVLMAERVDRLAAAVAEVLLVVDEQRRAVLGGELGDGEAADRQPAVGGDGRRCRAAG